VRPGRAADHLPPSSAAVMEEQSYTSTLPLGHTGPVTGSLYLYIFYLIVLALKYFSHVMYKANCKSVSFLHLFMVYLIILSVSQTA